MPRVLVLYHSQTGHTKKMAQAVGRGARSVKGVQVDIKHVDEAKTDDLLCYDGFAVGSPCHCGLPSWKLKRFFDESLDAWGSVEGKVACAFASQGGRGGGGELTAMAILNMLINYGFLVFGVTDYVAPKMTLHYGAVGTGEPDRDELAACRRLGQKLAQNVKRIRA